jgi:hypothetical protein
MQLVYVLRDDGDWTLSANELTQVQMSSVGLRKDRLLPSP